MAIQWKTILLVYLALSMSLVFVSFHSQEAIAPHSMKQIFDSLQTVLLLSNLMPTS